MLWINGPGTFPVWHAFAEGQVFVVSGPGEQYLPWLPDHVQLIARSKASGGRLIVVNAGTEVLAPDSPPWQAAVAALAPIRLNAAGTSDDLSRSWAANCTVHAFTPTGDPVEEPGRMPLDGGFAVLRPGVATTGGWRPWHTGGRPAIRRRLRRQVPDNLDR